MAKSNAAAGGSGKPGSRSEAVREALAREVGGIKNLKLLVDLLAE